MTAEEDVACSALAKCVLPRSGEKSHLSPGETAALLAAAASASSAAAVRLRALRLLRAEAARIEKDHAAAVDFGRGGGVRAAVGAVSDSIAASGDEAARADRVRMATEGAAALADMVASSGANKVLLLQYGGVKALVSCVEHPPRTPLESGLLIQACRALGNLTFGWGDVDDSKNAIGAHGASVVVASTARALAQRQDTGDVTGGGAPAFRWHAHALRNFSVRSVKMQTDIGKAGGTAALCLGLRVHSASPRAQEVGCKALAYVIKDHDANLASAAAEGALELAVAALASHPHDAAAVEAALTLLNAAIGSGEGDAMAARSATAVRCEAHLAALHATRALLESPPHSSTSPTPVESACGDSENGERAVGALLGRPSDHGALATSSLWLLASLTRALLSVAYSAPECKGGRRAVAQELVRHGLPSLFASPPGVLAQQRAKVECVCVCVRTSVCVCVCVCVCVWRRGALKCEACRLLSRVH